MSRLRTGQFGSFQSTWQQLALEVPQQTAALEAWAQSTDGQYQFLQNSTSNTPPAGISTATIDPPGTWSGAGASLPTPAVPGTYIPIAGATSTAAQVVDPAGTYSPAGASASTTDPAGTYSGAGASRAHAGGGGLRIFRSPGRPPPRRRSGRPCRHLQPGGRERADDRSGRHVQRRGRQRAHAGGGGHLYSVTGATSAAQSLSTRPATTVWRAPARRLLRSPAIMSRRPARAARRRTILAITRRRRARRRSSWRSRRSYRAR